jgi:hypothetical protein
VAKQVELRIDGLGALLKDFRGLPKEATKELRKASVDIANRHMVPSWKAAALTAGNWGPKLAESIRARSDRLPALNVGKDRAPTRAAPRRTWCAIPAFMGTRNDWAPFGDGTGWMAKRRPYQAQAIREWGQSVDRIVTKWNRSTL